MGVIFVSISGFSCEIYQGDLKVDFKCLQSEVAVLEQIVNKGEKQAPVLISAADLEEREKDASKVIQ